MIASIYLHRERTVVARWNIDDVPVLDALELFPAIPLAGTPDDRGMDAILRSVEGCGSVRCAVPTDQSIRHTYPVADNEDHWSRRTFEIHVTMSDVVQEGDSILDYRLPWRYHNAVWHTLIVVPQMVKHTLDTLSKSASVDHAVCAPAAEMVAVSSSARHRTQSVLGITRRGDVWEIYGADAVGKPGLWRCTDVDPGTDTASQVAELIQITSAATARSFDTVLLGGDHLTPALLDDIRTACSSLHCSVERHQPFRLVRASANEELRDRALRLGHVLAPLVGLVLSSEPPLSIPCASSPAR
jgi:hypothetical protein